MPVTADPDELFQTVAKLVAEALDVDQKINALDETSEAQELHGLIELKRRITHALFAVAPEALRANSSRRDQIFDLLSRFQASHARAENTIARRTRALREQLQQVGAHRAATAAYAQGNRRPRAA